MADVFNGDRLYDCNPQVGVATVEVLERAGYRVILANGACCGRPMISKGMLKDAKEHATWNVNKLLPYVEQGVPVVGLEPSEVSFKTPKSSVLKGIWGQKRGHFGTPPKSMIFPDESSGSSSQIFRFWPEKWSTEKRPPFSQKCHPNLVSSGVKKGPRRTVPGRPFLTPLNRQFSMGYRVRKQVILGPPRNLWFS